MIRIYLIGNIDPDVVSLIEEPYYDTENKFIWFFFTFINQEWLREFYCYQRNLH